MNLNLLGDAPPYELEAMSLGKNCHISVSALELEVHLIDRHFCCIRGSRVSELEGYMENRFEFSCVSAFTRTIGGRFRLQSPPPTSVARVVERARSAIMDVLSH
jgi:hypothetical protein